MMLHRRKDGPDFDFELIDNVIVIYLDRDGRSTHIQSVLDIIATEMDLGSKTIIYRDPQKVYDGIHHLKGTFRFFYPISETVLDKALTKANRGGNALH